MVHETQTLKKEEENEHLTEKNCHQNLVTVKPCPKGIKTIFRRKLKWILVLIFLMLVLVMAAVFIGIIWPKLDCIISECENGEYYH